MMKRIFLLSCLTVCTLGIFSSSAMAEQSEAIAHRAEEPIAADGDLEEWDLSSPVEIQEASQVIRDESFWQGETDLSCVVYLMWDEENLYLAADVKEASPFGAVGILSRDMEDNFKLYISTNPDADPEREAYDTNDFLVYLMMDNQNWYTAIDRSMIEHDLLARFTSDGMETSADVLEGYEKAYAVTEDGFIFEAVIPWSNFSNDYIEQYVPSEGDSVSFDFCITDNDYPYPNTEASVQMSWCGSKEIDTNPSLWGILTFE